MSKGMRLHIPSSFNYHLKIMTLDSTKQREPFCEFQLNWQVIVHLHRQSRHRATERPHSSKLVLAVDS